MTPQELDLVAEAPPRAAGESGGKKARAVKAAPAALIAGMTCAEAFRTIAGGCFAQVVANRALAHAGDPDGLHQMRVGLRRLRAAMSLFGAMLADPESRAVGAELKWIARELAPVRELDVFIGRVVGSAGGGEAADPGTAALVAALKKRRDAAAVRARAAIDSAGFAALLRRTPAWIDSGDWAGSGTGSDPDMRERPAADVAVAGMEGLRAKIARKGRHLAALDPARRHRLRIRVKKLRYAADFLAGAFPGKQAERRRKAFAAALGRLQDALGDLNDVSVHRALVEELATGDVPAGSAFAAGRLAGREEARLPELLREAEAAWASVAGAKVFWK